ncbi:hypothetical protein AGABI2DRAFT_147958 [Agaricus bisporus var. bisporus H97]|uniref:hypothetical protein n=1 Tax=Agaricus bisporus var. bisporus (strain H97 / ATCC MYA-4626 / FGSC 10389) TaxID=936046 RepID=UPI00029F5AFA|nr:hypothetical protein AGABI2DRAFT_147958 [Agaricus bisporus var. bisporus H97]EKV51624.1 hypothetical protein AGABI2DRAFT_147958 [Agaricus bisporus var. bisporus H97]
MLTDIQLISDLHLRVERGDQPLYTLDFPWTPERLFEAWLGLQLTRLERVFFVSGHYEPYVGTLIESEVTTESFATKAATMHEQDRIRIAGFTPKQYQKVREKDLRWLKESIEAIRASDSSRKIVVFTTMPPTVDGTSDPKWVGGLTNSAFTIKLTEASW